MERGRRRTRQPAQPEDCIQGAKAGKYRPIRRGRQITGCARRALRIDGRTRPRPHRQCPHDLPTPAWSCPTPAFPKGGQRGLDVEGRDRHGTAIIEHSFYQSRPGLHWWPVHTDRDEAGPLGSPGHGLQPGAVGPATARHASYDPTDTDARATPPESRSCICSPGCRRTSLSAWKCLQQGLRDDRSSIATLGHRHAWATNSDWRFGRAAPTL